MKTKGKRIIALIFMSLITMSFVGCARTKEERAEYKQMTPEEQAVADGEQLYTLTVINPISGETVREIDKVKIIYQYGHGVRHRIDVHFFDANGNEQETEIGLGTDLAYYESLWEDEE